MLEAAGVGVAVKNAEDALKQLADVVMPFTNDEDAVAEIIEKFGIRKLTPIECERLQTLPDNYTE